MSGSISLSGPFELTNLTAPASGITKALRFNIITPTGGGTTVLDMSNYIQALGSFRPQSMTVDNTQNNTPVTVNEIWFGWQRVINAGQIVSFNYPAVALPKFTFTTAAASSPVVTLYDFPIFPENYFNSANASGQTVIVGNTPLPVSFPAPYTANKGIYNTNFYGSATSDAVAIGTSGLTTYLVGFDFSITGNTSIATAGANTFELAVGSTVIFKQPAFLPSTAGTSGLLTNILRQRFSYPMLFSLGSQPTLTLTSTNALATGAYNLNTYTVDM